MGCSTPVGHDGTGTGSRTGRAESPAAQGACSCSCRDKGVMMGLRGQKLLGRVPGCWWQPCAGETAPAGERGLGERTCKSGSERREQC